MSTRTAQAPPRAHVHRSGSRLVPAPARRVFPLLTPEGERTWIDGWAPSYPGQSHPDESPGTVFLTHHHGLEAVWLIVEMDAERLRSAYAYVIPGVRATLVRVACVDEGSATRARITYDVTALAPDHDDEVREFGEGFEVMLDEWERRLSEIVGSASSD